MANPELQQYKLKMAEAKARAAEAKVKEKQLSKKKTSVFKSVSSAYKPTAKLSKTLLSYGEGFAQTPGTQRVQAGPGRPKSVFIHRSPFTGKPIPAPQFYKEMRAFRRVQAQQADVVQQQQQQRFARQGVAPQQIQNVVEQRMRQQFIQQQMQQQPQMQPRPVQQMPPQFQRPVQQAPMGSMGLVGRRVPSKLKFINEIESGTYQGPRYFQQKWW